MNGIKNGKIGDSKTNTGENKCFFCNCKEELKSFKAFFICKTCVNAAINIAEEDV